MKKFLSLKEWTLLLGSAALKQGKEDIQSIPSLPSPSFLQWMIWIYIADGTNSNIARKENRIIWDGQSLTFEV